MYAVQKNWNKIADTTVFNLNWTKIQCFQFSLDFFPKYIPCHNISTLSNEFKEMLILGDTCSNIFLDEFELFIEMAIKQWKTSVMW